MDSSPTIVEERLVDSLRPKILSFYCEVQDKLGNTLSSSYNRDVSTADAMLPGAGDVDPTFRRVVRALRGMTKGEATEIHLPAEDAYGLYDERLVMNIPIANVQWQGPIQVGQEILAETMRGDRQIFRVTRVQGKDVVLDGNHPLAGQDLVVRIQITASRPDRNVGLAVRPPEPWGESLGKVLH